MVLTSDPYWIMTFRMKQVEREKVEAQIKTRYEAVINSLTERARRLFVAAEARVVGSRWLLE